MAEQRIVDGVVPGGVEEVNVGTLCRAVRLSLLGLGPVPHTLTSQVPQFLAHLVDDFELVIPVYIPASNWRPPPRQTLARL